MKNFMFQFLIFSFLGLSIFASGSFFMGGFAVFSFAWEFSLEIMVFLITLLIIFFSITFFCFFYFSNSLDLLRFFSVFFSFLLSMMILILHKSIFSLFLAWDGLGISSFFLVAYYMNWSSVNGALVTVLTNRFGDFCLFWFFSSFLNGSFWGMMNLFPLVFLIGAFTKSAQFPFSNWLPLAMAAPTPVSSLVHSSTLVTAGIFIILRYYIFFNQKNFFLTLFFFGLLTILIAGFSSLTESDMKKIIALSTLSQMGFLILSLSFSLPIFSFYHLISHAFFKSCLFMQVGYFIVNFYSNQDERLFSKPFLLSASLNLISLICVFSLCGLIFLSGFFSKEFILLLFSNSILSMLIFLSVWMSMALTFLYSFRLVWGWLASSPLTFYSMSSSSALFFSLPLVFLGGFGGFFLLKNSFFLFFSFVGLEKFFPLFIIFLSLSVFFNLSKISFFTKNMIFLDNLVSSLNSSMKIPLKMNDMLLLTQMKNFLKTPKYSFFNSNMLFSFIVVFFSLVFFI